MSESGPLDLLEGHRYFRLTSYRGKPKVKGSIHAEARIMGKDEEETPNRLIDQEYGWQYRLFNRILELPRNPPEHVFLELRPAGDLE
jgi:hypothetical protein